MVGNTTNWLFFLSRSSKSPTSDGMTWEIFVGELHRNGILKWATWPGKIISLRLQLLLFRAKLILSHVNAPVTNHCGKKRNPYKKERKCHVPAYHSNLYFKLCDIIHLLQNLLF